MIRKSLGNLLFRIFSLCSCDEHHNAQSERSLVRG